MIKTRVNRLRGVEGRNSSDQIAICAFYSFSVEVQTNAGYTMRLGLGAPLVARKYIDLARAKSESPVNKFII